MKNARPQNWKNIIWEDKIVQENIDRMKMCQENANKSKALDAQ
jgi:hypothetical protein